DSGTRQGLEEGAVPLSRSNVMEALPAVGADVIEGQIARRDDRIPSLANDALFVEYAGDVDGRSRRVRDENNRAAARTKRRQRGVGLVKGPAPIVDDTPHIAQQDIVAGEEWAAAFNDGGRLGHA